MAYTKTVWEDIPSEDTPITSTALNNIENGIETVDTALENLENNVNNGWVSAGETWEYASVDDPTGVIYATGDVTGKYSLGMRIKFTNNSNTVYGIITALSSYDSENDRTSVTFLHEINPSNNHALYLMANSTITNNYYSSVKVPFGFPLNPDKWSVTVTNNTNKEISNPTTNTWYDSGLSITVPIGVWELETGYSLVALKSTSPVAAFGTLSSTLAETIPSITTVIYVESSGVELFYKNSTIVNFSSKVTLKLITKTSWGSMTTIGFAGTNKTIELRAVCEYL